MKLLDGRVVSQAVKDRLKTQTEERIIQGKKLPHLAAILIGNNGASETYVASKVKSCAEVGFKSTLIRLDGSVTEQDLLFKLAELNEDFDIDGILVQLPLPKHISEEKVIESIYASKDVDGTRVAYILSRDALRDFAFARTLWSRNKRKTCSGDW
jgi:methylenetetrahydrofolate dehydrogenase (NADP+)/methenyltetrahydrofolate cyclohydrolase